VAKQNFIVANNDGFEGKNKSFGNIRRGKVQNFNKFNKEGDTVKVDFNISTNEWKERYFHRCRLGKCLKPRKQRK
jgi:hypothetical protein